MVNARLRPFGATIFGEMTRLAQEHDAINLAQGFPDFEGPADMVEAAVEALRSGHNQYARSQGTLPLVRAVADKVRRDWGLDYDPMSEVGVFAGATEALAAFLLGHLEPGDEVVTFEPCYDSYAAIASLAGARVRACPLRFPDYELDVPRLASLFGPRTRVLLLNNPHNPTGKVFRRDELEQIAALCRAHGVVVLSDEVYEHLTYDGAPHVPIASLPGMRERTLTVSSSGKTFSFTGWKVGWATGPAAMVGAAQAAHQFLTFSTPAPLQLAVAAALARHGEAFFAQTRREYVERRDLLVGALREVGFHVPTPAGAYFALADFGDRWDGDDRSFARYLTARVGVAALPTSPFYLEEKAEGRRLVRFAFCKRLETLERAVERLRAWDRPER